MAGHYQKIKGNELLILNNDETFISLRNYHQKSDAIIPLCDTLATGKWNQRKAFITLKNADNFNNIEYLISESERNSKDSIYINYIATRGCA